MDLPKKHILVTGAAGFIGYHVSKKLLELGMWVTGVDNLNEYYSHELKSRRGEMLSKHKDFRFLYGDLANKADTRELFRAYDEPFDAVIHLAGQPGVRYSIEEPYEYLDCNLTAFLNVLEGCRFQRVSHLIYASSSSVYGDRVNTPYRELDFTDAPISLYAATKKANELMAHAYSHLFTMPSTGLRFFTVYGPWGRPDMAYWKFTDAILNDRPIEVYNSGVMTRDMTYIDDVVEYIVRLIDLPPTRSRVLNVGNADPVKMSYVIGVIEHFCGKKANRICMPMQPGDVGDTFADTSMIETLTGVRLSTPVETGLQRFVEWYKEYDREVCA